MAERKTAKRRTEAKDQVRIPRSLQEQLGVMVGQSWVGVDSINRLVTRAMLWFVNQKPAIQAAVLRGSVPGLEQDHARLIHTIGDQVANGVPLNQIKESDMHSTLTPLAGLGNDPAKPAPPTGPQVPIVPPPERKRRAK